MYRQLITLAFFATVASAMAGTDGYLRYCEPLSIRFAEPSPLPPPVNELILALDLPAEDPKEDKSKEMLADLNDEMFNSKLINDLITGNAGSSQELEPETNTEPVVISAGSSYEDLEFPDIPIRAPGHEQNEAQTIESILGIFSNNGGRDRGRRDKGTVIGVPISVPPPEFTPPKSSKSTYIVD